MKLQVECNRAQPRFLPTCSSAVIQLPFGGSGTGGGGGAGGDRPPESDGVSEEGSAAGGAGGEQDDLSLSFPPPTRSLFGYDYGMDRAVGGVRRCAFIGPFRRITPQQSRFYWPSFT